MNNHISDTIHTKLVILVLVFIPLFYFREQKLFIEASDWEAKFYQIQSKYLLLLNELHNPQVTTFKELFNLLLFLFEYSDRLMFMTLMQIKLFYIVIGSFKMLQLIRIKP